MSKSNRHTKRMLYVRVDGNKVLTRPVTRGRKPLGYIKFQVNDDGTVSDGATRLKIPIHDRPITIILPGSSTTLEEFRSSIKPLRVEQKENGLTLCGCDVIGGRSPIRYLNAHPVQSRIDVDLTTGDISLWTTVYEDGSPDVIIQGAIDTEVVS